MLTTSTITLLYNYHYWANTRFLHACEKITAEQWDKSLGHSWDSVHGLLTHMLWAEMIWLARWEGSPNPARLAPEAVPALADIRVRWAVVETRLRTFIAACDDARLAADCHYKTTDGVAYSQPLGELMLHVANHGTHHRGELAAMLALLDVPHPEDDLLYYLREKNKR